ncbi:MAG: hypothetical protein QXF82_07960 [Nitrososphaeria archaeon]
MATLKYNPFIGNFDFTGDGGGESSELTVVTNDGSATSVGGSINLIASTGIEISATGDTITVRAANSGRTTAQTINAETKEVVLINLGTIPSIGVFVTKVVGYVESENLGVAYVLTRAAKTDGTSATLVEDNSPLVFEDILLLDANAEPSVSGNNVTVNITGVLGYTIDWTFETTFTAS